jgi:hypothetical protein
MSTRIAGTEIVINVQRLGVILWEVHGVCDGVASSVEKREVSTALQWNSSSGLA